MSGMPTRNDHTAYESGEVAESLSAFMDGEADMPAALCESESACRVWDHYHLIGDVLRSEALARPVSTGFTQRLESALAAEPPIVAPRRTGLRRFATRYGLPGAALAAAVVAVTWMAQPYVAPGGRSLQAELAPAEGTFTAASLGNTPVLVDYLDAHRHLAGISSVGDPIGLAAGR